MKIWCVAGLATFLSSLWSTADAGAWPRGEGNTFTSAALFFSWPDSRPVSSPDIYLSTYAEYGISERFTAVTQFGTADIYDALRAQTVVTLRWHVSQPDHSFQFAFDLGGGDKLGQAVYRVGASMGHGLSLGAYNGWLAVEATMDTAANGAQSSHDVSATFGVTLDPTWKVMLQTNGNRAFDDAETMKVTPSVVYKLTPKTDLEIGITKALRSEDSPVLKVALWHQF